MFTIGRQLRVRYVMQQAECFFILRQPSTAEIMRFSNDRVLTLPGGKVENNLIPAAEALFDAIALDAQQLAYADDDGVDKALDKTVPGWLAKIPAYIKLDVASLFLANRAEISPDEKKV